MLLCVILRIKNLATKIKVSYATLQDRIMKFGAMLIIQIDKYVLRTMVKTVINLIQVGI